MREKNDGETDTIPTDGILTCLPLVSEAGEVFTGFQIDNKNQYFTYLGVRTPVLRTSGEPGLFVQVMTGGVGYSFKTNG